MFSPAGRRNAEANVASSLFARNFSRTSNDGCCWLTGTWPPMATAAEVPTHVQPPPANDLATRAKNLLQLHGIKRNALRAGFVFNVNLQDAIDKHARALAQNPLPAAGVFVADETKTARKYASGRLAYKVSKVEEAINNAIEAAAASKASRARSDGLDVALATHEYNQTTLLQRAWATQNYYQAWRHFQETGFWKQAPSPLRVGVCTLTPLIRVPSGFAPGFMLLSVETCVDDTLRLYRQGALKLTFERIEQSEPEKPTPKRAREDAESSSAEEPAPTPKRACSEDAEIRGAVAAGLTHTVLPTGLHAETDAEGRPVDIGLSIGVAGLEVTLGPFSENTPCHEYHNGSWLHAGLLSRSPGLFCQGSGARKNVGGHFYLDPAIAAKANNACRAAAREVLDERGDAEEDAEGDELRAEQGAPPPPATGNWEKEERELASAATAKRTAGFDPVALKLMNACFK